MSRLLLRRDGALWSLAEMIWKYGELILRTNSILQWAVYMSGSMTPTNPPELGQHLREQSVAIAIADARRLAVITDWDGLHPQIDRLETKIGVNPESSVKADLEGLRNRISDELSQEFFFHLTPADVPLYMNKEPFGPKVARKFPKASEDIEEAAKSLALQRPTACVFHLMRAMEVVVKRLGQKVGVQNVEKEWGKILSDIGGAVEKMPKVTEKEKAKRNRWSEVHTHLYHVKQAWRNDTMHPKQTYTREQAQEVFAAVRVFSAHLAGLV